MVFKSFKLIALLCGLPVLHRFIDCYISVLVGDRLNYHYCCCCDSIMLTVMNLLHSLCECCHAWWRSAGTTMLLPDSLPCAFARHLPAWPLRRTSKSEMERHVRWTVSVAWVRLWPLEGRVHTVHVQVWEGMEFQLKISRPRKVLGFISF